MYQAEQTITPNQGRDDNAREPAAYVVGRWIEENLNPQRKRRGHLIIEVGAQAEE